MTISIMSSKATKPIVTKFHIEPPGVEESKICAKHLGHMASITTMPIYGKTYKNLLSQNQSTYCLKTWYIALGAGVLPRVFE